MYSSRKVPPAEAKTEALKAREADTGPDTQTQATQPDAEGGQWSQPKTLLKPPNQVKLTPQELEEELTRVLNANNPLAPQNYARFSNKDRTYKTQQNVEHTVCHFEFEGYLVYKEDSSEAAVASTGTGEGREGATAESGTSAGGDGAAPESPTREEAEEGKKGKPPGRNQFNFSERASQTPGNPSRDRSTNTDPPPQRTLSDSVNQWTIFDAYMEDAQAKERAKEKGKAPPPSKGPGGHGDSSLPPLPLPSASAPDPSDLSSLSRNPDLWRTLSVLERMAGQNTYDDVAQDFKYWEDEADEGREGRRGTLLPLWYFAHEPSLRKSATALSWSPKFPDLFAVGYGSYDFVRQGPGQVAVFSFKNPSWPEWMYATESGVMCLDFHTQHPSLLAVGLYDGTVQVYDLQSKTNGPLFRSRGMATKHADPVWQVRWQRDDLDDNANFCSVSGDGRVSVWTVLKNELSCTDIIHLTLPSPFPAAADEDALRLASTASGACLDFRPPDGDLFVVGTEEGRVHLCSKSYSSTYLRTFTGHHMAVYAARYSPFHPQYFLTCGADWTVKLWDQETGQQAATWDLGSAVGDVAWAPYSSTVFSAGTTDGKVFVFDLSVNKYEPLCEQQVAKKAKVTHVAFNEFSPVILVGDDRGTVTSLKLSPNLRGRNQERMTSAEKGEALDRLVALVTGRAS